ncbi:MAG TPA: type VII secretion protein EccCa [Mycolicibacillus parakoreensis]|nr:type VII secretion protein EccCa [Mycolicibacillus parakoreensis]
MREIYTPRRRVAGPIRRDEKFLLDPPPELPRSIQVGAVRKALPFVFGVAIVGMIVIMFVSGFRQMNPMYLFFMAMMALGLFQSLQGQGANSEMSTPEVNSERAEYLRYLSATAAKVRAAGERQRAGAEWSHPDPELLDAAVGSPRMWERGSTDHDYLKVRVGRTPVALSSQVKVKPVDSELDLEPVTKTALQHMRAVQQTIPHCPKAVDLCGIGMVSVYGDRDLFASATRSWVCQLVCWHSPSAAAVAIVSPELETRWGWAKWLPHTETTETDGAGPARYLATSLDCLEPLLAPLIKDRSELVSTTGVATAEGPSKSHRHLLVIVDDPRVATAALKRLGARDGVTVVGCCSGAGPDRDYATGDRELVLLLDRPDGGRPSLRQWRNFRWRSFCEQPDLMAAPVSRNLARLLSQWDVGATGRQNAESQAVQGLLGLLNIDNAARLDVDNLWARRPLDDQLRIPVGLQPGGAPLMIDLKDEADGGNGPHGLMIGMTGSGKSKLLTAIVFGLLVRHSPDVVQVFLGDFKDEAGMDAFAGYPHTVAVVSNMEEKRSLVERFGETLFGILDRRGRIFKETGTRIKGAAFESLREYNETRAARPEAGLPAIPTMFVILDEFSLMLKDHPNMAEVFDVVTRKGRSYGMFFLFASQTLDEGVIKKIPDNTQYRFGLKVASPSISRRVIGTEDAYHIPDGKQYKGTGFFVRAPGAEPTKFRGFLLPDRYEPPVLVDRTVIAARPRVRVFTAAEVRRDDDTVIEEIIDDDAGLVGPPRSLVLTVGLQLAAAWGKEPEQLWSPPLDDPIPLDAVLRQAEGMRPPGTAGIPWWPLGEIDQPRLLTHGLVTYCLNQGHVSLLGMRSSELSMVVQTFVLAAAGRYSPRDIGFYILSYGGPELAALRDLPHVGAIGGRDRSELTARIFGDFDAMLARRRALFHRYDIASLDEYRRRRTAGEAGLDDGYPLDIFLIVDGWEDFLSDNTSLLNPKNPYRQNVEDLAGGELGVHIMVTAADWIKLGMTLQSRLSCRWELKLAGSASSQVRPRPEDAMIRPQDRIPANEPGRGITSAGDVIRFAVGRLDGRASMDDTDLKIREAVGTLAARHAGERRAPAPRLLPTALDAAGLENRAAAGEQFAIGMRGRDLEPLTLDFAEDPLLGVYGDSKTGKTTFLRALLRGVVRRRAGEASRAIVMVCDTKRRLSGETRFLIENDDYYETDPGSIAERLIALGALLEQRTPPKDLSWEAKRNWTFRGPVIYLFIDDVDTVPAQVQIHRAPQPGSAAPPPGHGLTVPTWAPLAQHLANAHDIGLRIVFTHKAAGSYLAESTPTSLAGLIATQRTNRILLASRSTADKIGGMKFEADLPPGRGYLIATHSDNEGHVQLALPAESPR